MDLLLSLSLFPQRVARLEEFDQLVSFFFVFLAWRSREVRERRVALLQAGFETKGLIGYPLSPVFASY